MNAAVVQSFDKAPRYGEFREPPPTEGMVVVRVRAVALSNLVKGQASGRHYSSGKEIPFVPGYDGVGVLPDGRRVYFFGPPAPFGSMADLSLADPSRTIPLPDSLDDVTAAALGNPGLASWGALLGRAQLVAGETVLVNGATGVAGQQAIQAARQLGAKRVIATGRDEDVLASLKSLGVDETVSLRQSPEELAASFAKVMPGVNVVLDYLWGPSAEAILSAMKGSGKPEGEPRLRYVQIGSISGDAISLKGELLRSSGVELMGSGLGSLSAKSIVEALTKMFEAYGKGADLKIDAEAIPLQQAETMWNCSPPGGRRLVFTI